MYYCKNCDEFFNNLCQYYVPTEDKMYQVCPHCKSENVILENQLTQKEKRRILREKKLKRIVNENFIVKFFKLF